MAVNFLKRTEDLKERQRLLALPKRLAGTGHRPHKLAGYSATRKNPALKQLFQDVETELTNDRPDLVIAGGALGFDQYLATCAVELGIPLLLALPCQPFGDNWAADSVGAKAHRWLLSRAAYVHIVTPMTYKQAGPVCLQWRNIWMVDNATHLLACWDGSSGGTCNCVEYAEGYPSLVYKRLWKDEYRAS